MFWEGEEKLVVMDDYLPCLPLGEPLLTNQKEREGQVECWGMLVEKAVCKLLGSYYGCRQLTT